MAYREASAKFSEKPYSEHTKEEQQAWDKLQNEHEEITRERDRLIAKYFSEDFRYISLTGGVAEYCREYIFEGNIYGHYQCYRQPVTVNMQTASGEEFSVSFVMKCDHSAELPFENIVYSPNTPEEFKVGFSELFGD